MSAGERRSGFTPAEFGSIMNRSAKMIASAFTVSVGLILAGLLLENLRGWPMGFLVTFSSVIPFVLVIFHRKRIPWVWFIGPASFVLLITGAEAGLRASPLGDRFLPMGVGRFFSPHPYLFWVPKSDSVDTKSDEKSNSNSDISEVFFDPFMFRSGKTDKIKPTGRYRVITMGGSNAWGANVEEYTDTFSGQLEKSFQLNYPDSDIEVIAAGAGGYCVYHCLVLHKLFLREYKPDLVILYANINDRSQSLSLAPFTWRKLFRLRTGIDISDLWITEFDFPKQGSRLFELQDGARKLRTYNAAMKLVTNMRGASPDIVSKKMMSFVNSIRDYEKNLSDLAKITGLDGASLILVDAFDYSLAKQTKISQRGAVMMRVAKKNKLIFVSAKTQLMKDFEPEELFFVDDRVHLNVRGHLELARLLAEVIEKNKLVRAK
jgi:GDSL-like Lipase/Acylhydrolase family